MALQSHPLATQRIADIVRFDAHSAQVFADAGIGPRYLFWTVEHAAREQGVELDRVIRGLLTRFRQRGLGQTDAQLRPLMES